MFVAIDEQQEIYVALDRAEGIKQREEGGCTVETPSREYLSDLPARDVAQRFEAKLESMREGMGSAMGGLNLDV